MNMYKLDILILDSSGKSTSKSEKQIQSLLMTQTCGTHEFEGDAQYTCFTFFTRFTITVENKYHDNHSACHFLLT